jgi:hypothetical protein
VGRGLLQAQPLFAVVRTTRPHLVIDLDVVQVDVPDTNVSAFVEHDLKASDRQVRSGNAGPTGDRSSRGKVSVVCPSGLRPGCVHSFITPEEYDVGVAVGVR